MTTVSYELTLAAHRRGRPAYVEDLLKMRREAEAGHPPGLREANIAAFLFIRTRPRSSGLGLGPLGLKLPSEDIASCPSMSKDRK